jgi:hypothetical protein
MKDYTDYVFNVRIKLYKAKNPEKENTILKAAVEYLSSEGLSAEQIKEVLKIQSLNEAQSNDAMINNNNRYLELLNNILNNK